MNGLFIADDGFDLVCGDVAVGRRRHLDAAAIAALEGFSHKYGHVLGSAHDGAGLLALGRELYDWLDGTERQLHALLQRAERPLRFEVCAANLLPSSAEWSLLRAPWELLAGSPETRETEVVAQAMSISWGYHSPHRHG
jgi:hypothetical protein